MFPALIFILAHGMVSIPGFVLAPNLQWPKYGVLYMFGCIMQIIGLVLGSYEKVDLFTKELSKENFSTISIALGVVWVFSSFAFWATIYCFSTLVVMSWVDMLTKQSKINHIPKAVAHAKRIIAAYKGLENGLGCFFFTLVTFCQVLWILTSFFVIANVITPISIESVFGFGCIAVSIVTEVSAFILTLDACHKSLNDLAAEVRNEVLEMEEGREKEIARNILQVILMLTSLHYGNSVSLKYFFFTF